MIPTIHLFGFVLFLGAWSPVAQQHPDSAASTTSTAVPLFDNLGTHHHPITTSLPSAQRYFDQGIRLFYAFNQDESRRAFEEAARRDPSCAMAYWGIALALGPNINNPMDREQEAAAYRAIQKALSFSSYVPEPERGYIEALSKRYSMEPDADRKALRVAYADAMGNLSQRYPDDLDAATLFADALLNLRPWDQWTPDGQPQPGTLEILSTLERVLKENPNHPGANHYYIHALEASPQPERALPSAERIAKLMPGAGHLVHMPSHIYFRLGRYSDAAESSALAAAVDRDYIQKHNPQGVSPMMFYQHNIYFLWAALCMEGRSTAALRSARELVANFPDDMVRQMRMLEFFRPVRLFAMARFGRWGEILKEPRPSADFPYLTGMWHYARGLAFAATGRPRQAATEKDSLVAIATAVASRIPPEESTASALLLLASSVLEGELEARRGKTEDSVRHLREAVRLQDRLRYDEPPAWYFPVRQSLGAVLLTAGRVNEAESVYRDDLQKNPENGWSLYGLAKSLRAQKKYKEASSVEERFRKAWARADVRLSASRF